MPLTFRELESNQDYAACVELQKETWGENFSECVPPAILLVAQKVGGVAAGAFDETGQLVGFVFGLTGIKEGRRVNWSHMLAVKKDRRDQAIGRKLKLFQRELLLKRGVQTVFWTYDPLVARNAHLNFNKLGVSVKEYVPEMYIDDSGSDLHRGIGMDRFIVEWALASKRVEQAISGQLQTFEADFSEAKIVNTELDKNGAPIPVETDLSELSQIRLEIPPDIDVIQNESLQLAGKWRACTRRAFTWYLEKGYEVKAFYRDKKSSRCFYVVAQTSSFVGPM